MGFLAPLFLLAASAVAVPILLHLFQRHRTRRLPFPAIRYLRRTEREHARRIRFRQLLLLLFRCAAVLLLTVAGARMFIRGRSEAHEPTALAIVLDNSMSSGRVLGTRRVLDELKEVADATLDHVSPEDRIWVVRAGEPWDVTVPGGAAAARARVAATEPTAASGDLAAALARARGLVEAAGLEAAEIHLLSDLQVTALKSLEPTVVGAFPVVVWYPDVDDAPNRFLADLRIGGGLPPLANQRTDVAVTLGEGGDSSLVTARLVIGDRIRAAASGRQGEVVVLPVGPFPVSEVAGWVETDPDALGADDRRYFAFDVRPPVRVGRVGPPSFFVDQGLAVLADAGRARVVPPDSAEVLVAVAAEGANRRRGRLLVVVPPEDPTLLPALNRRLATSGIPWSYQPPDARGEGTLGENRLPVDLEGLRVLRHYRLEPTGGSPPDAEIPARMASGEPFLIGGRDAEGPYMLLAAPLDPGWTSLPLEAGMVPFLQWIAVRTEGSAVVGRSVLAGEAVSLSAAATQVETPDGIRHPVDGTQTFRATAEAGLYGVLVGDSVVARVAVNPPPGESLLRRVGVRELEDRLGPRLERVDDIASWERTIFTQRQGPELWRPLLLAALLLLLAEGWIAAPGEAVGTKGIENPGGSGATAA